MEKGKAEVPPVKTNEANLEELNKKIVEIKRKIILSGESLISIFRRTSKVHDLFFSNFIFLFACLCLRGSEKSKHRRVGELEANLSFILHLDDK